MINERRRRMMEKKEAVHEWCIEKALSYYFTFRKDNAPSIEELIKTAQKIQDYIEKD
jgi:hypothetical protein